MIKILSVLSFLFFLGNSHASQYAEENLFEVLVNANVRSGPSDDSDVKGVLFGSFVVAADPKQEGASRTRLAESSKYIPAGYVSSSLLADPSTSYRMVEVNNGIHKIKHFYQRKDFRGVWPNEHARIYDLEGNFISNLPRAEDLVGAGHGQQIRLSGFESKSPYYQIELYSEGRLYYLKVLSKEPFGEVVLTVDEPLDLVKYDSEKGKFSFGKREWQYYAWLYSGAASPSPWLDLKFVDGKLVVADELMKKPAPSKEEFLKILEELKQEPLNTNTSWRDLGRPLSNITRAMLDLIYSGNPDTARELLKRFWPAELKLTNMDNMSRSDYESELEAKVRSSKYFRPWMLYNEK